MKKFIINLINLISKKTPNTKSNLENCGSKHSLDQLGQLGLRNSLKGVTLVELLIYMGLLSIFLITLTDLFVSIMDVRTESEAISSVEQDGRYILSRLSYDINRASSITTPATLGGSSSSLAIVTSGVTYTYSVSANNLVLTNDLGSNNLNSSESTVSTTASSFQRIGNAGGKDTIKITLTVASKAQRPGGAESKIFQTTVGRR